MRLVLLAQFGKPSAFNSTEAAKPYRVITMLSQSKLQIVIPPIIVAMISIFASKVIALQDDRDQAIEFRADEAVHDEVNGTLTYTGSVFMKQGSMNIRADKIIVYGNQEAVTKIEALGRPVSLAQTPRPNADPIEAKAEQLIYDISDDVIRLNGRAKLSQEGSSLTGERIDYDVRRSIIRASGNKDRARDSDDDGRIRMIIPSKALRTGE